MQPLTEGESHKLQELKQQQHLFSQYMQSPSLVGESPLQQQYQQQYNQQLLFQYQQQQQQIHQQQIQELQQKHQQQQQQQTYHQQYHPQQKQQASTQATTEHQTEPKIRPGTNDIKINSINVDNNSKKDFPINSPYNSDISTNIMTNNNDMTMAHYKNYTINHNNNQIHNLSYDQIQMMYDQVKMEERKLSLMKEKLEIEKLELKQEKKKQRKEKTEATLKMQQEWQKEIANFHTDMKAQKESYDIKEQNFKMQVQKLNEDYGAKEQQNTAEQTKLREENESLHMQLTLLQEQLFKNGTKKSIEQGNENSNDMNILQQKYSEDMKEQRLIINDLQYNNSDNLNRCKKFEEELKESNKIISNLKLENEKYQIMIDDYNSEKEQHQALMKGHRLQIERLNKQCVEQHKKHIDKIQQFENENHATSFEKEIQNQNLQRNEKGNEEEADNDKNDLIKSLREKNHQLEQVIAEQQRETVKRIEILEEELIKSTEKIQIIKNNNEGKHNDARVKIETLELKLKEKDEKLRETEIELEQNADKSCNDNHGNVEELIQQIECSNERIYQQDEKISHLEKMLDIFQKENEYLEQHQEIADNSTLRNFLAIRQESTDSIISALQYSESQCGGNNIGEKNHPSNHQFQSESVMNEKQTMQLEMDFESLRLEHAKQKKELEHSRLELENMKKSNRTMIQNQNDDIEEDGVHLDKDTLIEEQKKEIQKLVELNETLIRDNDINNNDNGNHEDEEDSLNSYVIEKDWSSKGLIMDHDNDSSGSSNNENDFSSDDVISGKYTGYIDPETNNPNGEGTLRLKDDSVYIGNWKDGLYHGSGVYVWNNGDMYYGSWRDGKQFGKGVFVWTDGKLYAGNYECGSREGDGIMAWPYGATYKGQFHRGKRNGRGLYVYPDGRLYTGAFNDDQPHGHGTETDQEGRILNMGQWCMGEFLAVTRTENSLFL